MLRSLLRRPPALPVGAIALTPVIRLRGAWTVLAIGAVVFNAVVTALVAYTDTAPAFAFDEIHHLLMARMVAGFAPPDGSGAGYYPGWGVLLAPLWWLWDDPRVIYGLALAVGWLIGVATVFPLATLLRRARLDMPQAIVVAALVLCLPSRVAQADNVFSERLLFLLVVLCALASFRLWERPSHLRALLLAAAVAGTYFTHVRMLTLVLATVVWLVAFALKNLRVALSALAFVVIGYLAADRLGGWLDEALRRTPSSRGSTFLASIADTDPGLIARAVLGQVWGQIVGSYGLFAIGVVVLVVWCVKELRWRRLGRGMWLMAVLVATFSVSILTWAQDKRLYAAEPRLDAWVYGRYVEPVTALVCAFALAVVIRGVRTRVWASAVALFAAIAVPTLLWLAPQAPTSGSVTPAHIGGLMPWAFALPERGSADASGLIPSLTNANSFWLLASLSCAACLLMYLVVRRVRLVTPIALLVITGLGALGVDAASNDYRAVNSAQWSDFTVLRDVAEEYGPLDGAYDYNCGRSGLYSGVGMNMLSFALLPDITLVPYFSDDPTPTDADVILSCSDSEDLEQLGARRLAGFDSYESVAWIMPGELFDELEARGMLEE